MSVLPASRLSPSDLALLGNNLVPIAGRGGRSSHDRKRRRDRRQVAAVNRSLAAFGERLPPHDQTFWPALLA